MTPGEAVRTAAPAKQLARLDAELKGLLAALIALCMLAALFAPNFATAGNLLDILRQVAFTGIIAYGMTLVIVAGEIDVSVGSAIAFSSALFGTLAGPFQLPLWSAALAVVALGAAMGAGAGAIRAWFNIPSFIVTLAMFSALRGAAMLMTDAIPIPILDESFQVWGSGAVLGVPVPVLLMLATFAVFAVVASRTAFGRSVYAIGGNAEAAHLSGIPVKRTRTLLFALTGGLAAISGLLMTSRLGSATPSIGYGVEFAVITAVIVGGASLSGGRGSMLGTLLGGLFIVVLSNAMVLLGVNSYAQDVANGIVVLLAVLVRTRVAR
ncbi:putative sugar ABC transport system, permease protein YphD [Variovorax sp. WDL1]|nr:putative sugar ABC transport system, permease protein YphD [Variovorax sp. WDL1]